MDSSNINTKARASYPSSRLGTPLRVEPLESSSSAHTTTPQPVHPSPRFSAITRPNMYANQYSWEYISRDGIGSHHRSGNTVENTSGGSRPLSYPYNTFTNDRGYIEQQSVDIPNHHEYVEPIVARSRQQNLLKQPPYPLHSQEIYGHSAVALDNNYRGILRQPTAEDFLRPDHPLPAPPPKEYDSDQDLPVIEPDSYLEESSSEEHEPQHANTQSQQSNVAVPKRHFTTANAKAHSKVEMRPEFRRSQSEVITSSQPPTLTNEPAISEGHSTPVRVPSIGVDMYQPALGGLQMVSGIQRSKSKRDRVRRFISVLNPFHRERKFGRQQRR